MRYLLSLFIVVFGLGLFTFPVSAAVIVVESDFSSLHVGDIFTVDLKIDTEGQIINAVEAAVIFPTELLEFVASDDGESVVNLWIQKPAYQDLNRIILSGVTPGGFRDNEAELLSVTFKVINPGQGNIEIDTASLLLHDGLGTEAILSKQNLHIAVKEGESEVSVNVVDDEIPEAFKPEIIQDKDVFEGAHTLIFATEDKGSGMDYFVVKEGWFSRYIKVESPYKLKHQTLNKKISIKAVDRLGNERVEILYPQNWQPWYEYSYVTVSIFILCVLIFLTSKRSIRSFLKK
jgi:hypothetical protein